MAYPLMELVTEQTEPSGAENILAARLDGFERLGTITPFIQCGGDLSSKEGWRIAASILGDFNNPEIRAGKT